ncbi:unnamed protein product [Caenorhabditis brenneri]
MPPKIDWENDPESIEMLKFLIERTKDAKSPLGINTLAREFKEKSGCSQTVPCLNFRIQKLRERVAELDTIDTVKKVKIMFALSVSVDENFLKGLRKDADVEVDEKHRITKYKANDGSFGLEGDHSHSARNKDGWKHRKRESFVDIFQDSMSTTPGSVKKGAKVPKKRSINWKNDSELMNFLIERTTNAKSPLSISQLAREFKEKSGCSQAIPSLTERIRQLRGKVAESDTIDATSKVKMIFALSAPINKSYLKELQNVADVEIDGNNRITKYREKYGNFILEGDHSASAKHKRVGKMDPCDTETKVKMIIAMGVSVDEHLLNEKTANEGTRGELTGDHSTSAKMMSTTPGSMKRSAVEVPNSSKRTIVKSEDFAPADFEGSREPKPPSLRQSKLEEDPGAAKAPIFKSGGARRALRAPGAHISQEAPTRPKSEANDAYTPQIKILEAMKFLITPLDMPSLSPPPRKN